MFPLPFNFPFRKKDGTLTTLDDAISSGGGSYTLPTASANTKGGVKIGSRLTMTGEVLSADAQVPAYTSAEAGKVLTVDENGDLEWDTKGSGGGDAFVSYDFTKAGNRNMYSITYSSEGATFSNDGKGCIKLWSTLPNMSSEMLSDFTIYIDTGNLNISSGTHRRFVMVTSDSGFIYRSTGVWSFYASNWYDSEITDPTYFDNCKLKIYIDSDRKWHVYKDNVLVYEPNTTYPIYELYLGMTSNSLVGSIIKALRIYNGNYTET